MVGHNTFGDLTECEGTVTELADKEVTQVRGNDYRTGTETKMNTRLP